MCSHFLIHRAGDRSPGPRGEPLEEAEVWQSAPNFTRVLPDHDDDEAWRLSEEPAEAFQPQDNKTAARPTK